MQTNRLFLYCSRSVFFKKTMSLLISFFLLFNFLFSPYAQSVNLNAETRIQKDVFSAVLFVSETISKISMAVSNKFALKSGVSSSDSQPEPDERDNSPADGIVFFNPVQSKNADCANMQLCRTLPKKTFIYPLLQQWRQRKRIDKSIASDFLKCMLFYILSKSAYDGIAFKNGINCLFFKSSRIGPQDREGLIFCASEKRIS